MQGQTIKQAPGVLTDQKRNEPVSLWANEEVGGYALCADFIVNDSRKKVDDLRKQQAAYLASLPAEPAAAVDAALKLMHPDGATYPGKFEDALHLSKALRPMIMDLDLEGAPFERDALLWIVDQIMWALYDLAPKLDNLADILGNPRRLHFEAERERAGI